MTLMTVGVLWIAEDWLDPLVMFSLLSFPQFVLRPIMIITGLDSPKLPELFKQNPTDLALQAMLIFSLAYIAFVLGYSLRGNLAQALAKWIPGATAKRLRIKVLSIVVTAAFSFSAGVFLYFRSQFESGSEFVLASRQELFAGMYVF